MTNKTTKKKEAVDAEPEVEAVTETTVTKPKNKITFIQSAVVILVVGISALVAGVVWINKSDDLVIIPTTDIEDTIVVAEVIEQEVSEIEVPVVDTTDVVAEQETTAVVVAQEAVAVVADTQVQPAFKPNVAPYGYAPQPYVMPSAQAFNDIVNKQREVMQRNRNQHKEVMQAMLKAQDKRRQEMKDRASEFKAAAIKRRAEADERFIKAIQENRAAFEKSMQKGI